MEIVKKGEFTLEKLIGPDVMKDKLGLYARVIVPPHSAVPYHKHEGNCEIIYILSGAGKCKYEDGEETLAAGDCHYCPEGKSHALINNGVENLEFFAVVM